MSLEYDFLFNLVNNMNKVEGEKCMICYFPDKPINLLKLDCGHFFHKRCLVDSELKNVKKKIIMCPYCDSRSNLVQVIKNDINKNNLASFKKQKSCKISNIDEVRCKVILKSGKNKGIECNRINCKYHNKTNETKNFIIV